MLPQLEHSYVAILAGGSGTRLWPMSRQQMPKQFHILTGNRTLLQDTFDRVAAKVPPDRLFILTTAQFMKETRKQLDLVPPQNILVEPVARNTSAAMAFVADHIHRLDPQSLVAILPSDHVVTKPDQFILALENAFQVAAIDNKAIVTIGIQPTHPHTGLGYIQQGARRLDLDGLTLPAFRTKRFVEKPNLAQAKRYLRSGSYLWNGGYFVANTDRLLQSFADYEPELMGKIRRFSASRRPAERQAIYETIAEKQFDHAIAERYPHLHVIPADLGWSDVGNWASLYEVLKIETGSNRVIKGDHVGVDTENVLILGHNKLIATAGLKDVIIVDTPDVMLICHKDKAHEIKKLLEELIERGRINYL